MNVKDAIETRRSVRDYKPDVPSKEILTEVLEAARMAPTAVNKQPFRILCVTDKELLAELQKTYLRDWIKTAPCIIVVIANHEQSWHRKMDGKDHADIDAAIATDHMTLRATELGIDTCWVCNFDAAMAHDILKLDSKEEAVVLLPIGYAADESKPKVRKEASEIYKFI